MGDDFEARQTRRLVYMKLCQSTAAPQSAVMKIAIVTICSYVNQTDSYRRKKARSLDRAFLICGIIVGSPQNWFPSQGSEKYQTLNK